MNNNTQTLTLCAKCAALMSDAYIVKKLTAGVSKKVDCVNCKRHHYGGVYEITKKGARREGNGT